MRLSLEWIVLALFIVGVMAYTGLDKLPLTHPGNIKAADPFYHTMIVEGILDTKHWDTYPAYLALGETTAVNSQPPLLYVEAAALSTFTSIPSWASIYFFVSIFAGLAIIITFFLVKEAFADVHAAVLASAAVVLPVATNVWLYGIYIGFWIQVVAYTFILAFVWMAVTYAKTKAQWCLWIANICIATVILVHPQDLLPLFVPWLIVAWLIYKNNTVWSMRFKHLIALSSVSAIAFVLMLPRFLVVWTTPAFITFGWYGLRDIFFSRAYIGGVTTPDLFFFPWWMLFLAGFGILVMLKEPKKYDAWLTVTGYFLFLTIIVPMILKDPYYVSGRPRVLAPFIILPIAAFFVSRYILRPIQRYIPLAVSVLVLSAGVMTYGYIDSKDVVQGLAYEHLPQDKYAAYQWGYDNIPADAKILVLEGTGQNVPIFMKRNAALVDMRELQTKAGLILQNKTLPDFEVDWAAGTLRHTHYRYGDKGFFLFRTMEKYDEWPKTVKTADFDYIMFEDLSAEVAQFNTIVVQLLQTKGFKIVYREGRFTFLQRGAA